MSSGMNSRFIPSEEIDERQVVQWRFGAVDHMGGLQSLPGLPNIQGAPDAHAAPGGAGMARTPASSSGFHSLSLPGRSDAPRLDADSMVLDVDADTPGTAASTPAVDEERLHELLEQARAEGHAEGLEQGRQEAQ